MDIRGSAVGRLARVALVGLVLAGSGPVLAEPVEVFRRAEPLEERVGRMELRRAYGARLDVIVDCESSRRGCREERIYDEVLRIDFILGHQEVEGDSIVALEEPAGTIYLATHFADDDRVIFQETLEQALRGLSADAFEVPFAGLAIGAAPFDKATVAPGSILPTWVCFQSSGLTTTQRFHRKMDGSRLLGTGAKQFGSPPTSVCRDIRIATDDAYPDIYWTLASPRVIRETSVEHDEVMALDTRDPWSLLEWPPGVHLVRRPMGGGAVASSPGLIREVRSRATFGADGWRYEAWAAPTTIPVAVLDRNAWLHGWTIRTLERRFGADPDYRVVEEHRLAVALIPTLPAVRPLAEYEDGSFPVTEFGPAEGTVEQPEPQAPARVDRDVLAARIVEELEKHSDSPIDRVTGILQGDPIGLESDGWLVVICHPDGTATYSVPPTAATNRVTNSETFCGTVISRLGY